MKDQKTEVVEANVVETQPTDSVTTEIVEFRENGALVNSIDVTDDESGSNIGLIVGLGAGISLAAYGAYQLVKNVRNHVRTKKENREFIRESLDDFEIVEDDDEAETEDDSKKKSTKN